MWKIVLFSVVVLIDFNSQALASALGSGEETIIGEKEEATGYPLRNWTRYSPVAGDAGKKFVFSIEALCACGGGEKGSPDLYFIVYQCGYYAKDEKTRTKYVSNQSSAKFNNVFSWTYQPDQKQYVWLELKDVDDTSADDLMADTKCFNPFFTYDVPIDSKPEIEICSGKYKCTGTKDDFRILFYQNLAEE